MRQRIRWVSVLLFFLWTPYAAEAASITINVNVVAASSTLSYTVQPSEMARASNLPTVNYQINGNITLIFIITAPPCRVSVSPMVVNLQNGSSTIPVYIGGTIGGVPPSSTFTSIPAGSNGINLTGDLDESALLMSKPAGTYTGSFTITATLL
jgi:hypothetical protein